MVKVSVLVILLCGVGLPARAIGLNPFSVLHAEQTEGRQSSQSQDNITAAGQSQPCSPSSPNNCRPKEGVKAPTITYAPDPKYTKLARKEKLSGKTIVSMIVGVDGKPSQVHIVRSMAEGLPQELQPAALSLDEQAIKAVQEYRFKPAIYQGKPLAVELRVFVNFHLR